MCFLQLKSSLLLHIDGTCPIAEDIGRQVHFFLSPNLVNIHLSIPLSSQPNKAFNNLELRSLKPFFLIESLVSLNHRPISWL